MVQVDADHRMLGLVREVAVGVHGDARAAAIELLTRLRAMGDEVRCRANGEARLAELEARRKEWESELDQLSAGGGSPIPPRRALRELEKAMPPDAMVATDIGNVCSVSNSYLRFEQPQSFFAAMAFGNCGYAFPAAMGAKVARPDRPAVAYVGDGAWGMSLAEVLTCVRERIPATAVVFNNGQWGAEKKNQIDYYADRFVGTNLVNPSFAKIAEAMGADRHHRRSSRPGRRRASQGRVLRPVHRPRADADPGSRRALPARRAQEAGSPAGEVQGLHRRVVGANPNGPDPVLDSLHADGRRPGHAIQFDDANRAPSVSARSSGRTSSTAFSPGSRITISTRRLRCRPAAVSLPATG